MTTALAFCRFFVTAKSAIYHYPWQCPQAIITCLRFLVIQRYTGNNLVLPIDALSKLVDDSGIALHVKLAHGQG